MRRCCLQLLLFLATVCLAFGQVGNGTITGTVTDPGGAVVPNAAVNATNTATAVAYPAVTTNTGTYTITDLPVGTYTVNVTANGFKNYSHTNLRVEAAQTIRQDVPLEVGGTNESVTVTAEASLLKTESGDMSHNISIDHLDDLPLLGIGTANSGTSGVRNPYNSLQTLPGVSNYASSGQFTLNGLGGNMTETMRVEGQDSTSRLFGTYDYTQMGQPSADAIQEIAYQTSNYSAEYGQAGSAVINMTMKSGTNQFHGTGYDYFVNEDLNAGDPFSISPNGGKMRPVNRRNDFGGTLGGPVWIPKIYNGRNKTFFFFNYEQYLENNQYLFTDTVPAAAYLNGDFSAISPNGNCSLCSVLGIPTTPITTDPAGHPVYANEIFDPSTRQANGTATPFANNMIPTSRFDPTSLAILKLVPGATGSGINGNYSGVSIGNRYTAIPSIKIDQNLSDKDKLSFFWTRINTEAQIGSPLGNADGLPLNIGQYRGTFIPTYTTRLNYDRTLSPTLLLHAGAGFYHTRFDDHAANLNFDPASIGLSNFLIHRQFPSFTGMCVAPIAQPGCGGVLGGLQNIGTSGQIQTLNFEEKPTFNASATWIHGAHTFKLGAELYLEAALNGSFAGVTLATGTAPTSAPFTPAGSLGSQSMGFGFASFLLGDYTSITQTPQLNYRQGNQEWGLYIQDSWKVTRRLTVDYGLRWDYSTQYKEQYGRLGKFSPTTPNPAAGGILGATIYANTCNCNFYPNTYPYAIGPRLGVAYQLTPKTVLRGGWGINYQFVAASGGAVVSANGAAAVSGINGFMNDQAPGAIVTPVWPVTNPGRYPAAGITPGPSTTTAGGAPAAVDANALRPPRINQFSFGIQREITNSFIVEASYVGNRGVWEQGASFATSGPYGYLSQLSPANYAAFGLYPYPGSGPSGYNYTPTGDTFNATTGTWNLCTPGNDCDRYLLSQPLSNANVQAKLAASGHPGFTPYTGFLGTSLQSAIYPYPQFGNIAVTGSPTGNSKYDSMQIKVTKRLSHGLQAGGAFTWAKGFNREIPEDFFNPQGSAWVLQQIPPLALTFNVTYTLPKFAALPKYANAVVKDWQVGFFAQYQSGQFLLPPVSNVNAEFLPSEDVRTGQPLYLKDINDIHSYNPYTDVILNPAAWAPCPTNSVCGGAYNGAFGATSLRYYSDFRGPRQPRENGNLGRHFRVGKEGRYDLYIRGEFVNVFNRTIMPNPIATNPQTAPGKTAGVLTSGFGVINAYNAPGTVPAPTAGAVSLLGRTGTLIAKFTF